MVDESKRMDSVWGWRGVLGFIKPSVFGGPPDRSFYEVAPDGVEQLVATLGINRPSEKNLSEAVTHVDNAARQLADGGANFIYLGGPLEIIWGIDWGKEMRQRLEELTKLPSITQFIALSDALNALSVKKFIHVNPSYPTENIKNRFQKRYEADGFEMVNFKCLGLKTNAEARKVPMSTIYNLAREAYLETPQADAIFIDCGSWSGRQVIECLEQDIGKPVVQVQSLFLWSGLKALKIKAPVKGYGQLFETLL